MIGGDTAANSTREEARGLGDPRPGRRRMYVSRGPVEWCTAPPSYRCPYRHYKRSLPAAHTENALPERERALTFTAPPIISCKQQARLGQVGQRTSAHWP